MNQFFEDFDIVNSTTNITISYIWEHWYILTQVKTDLKERFIANDIAVAIDVYNSCSNIFLLIYTIWNSKRTKKLLKKIKYSRNQSQ